METTAINKILVVVLDNLGDAVMATSVLKPLKRMLPHAQIGLWTKKYARDLFRDQSLIDIHHYADPFWDTSPGLKKGSWPEFWNTWFEIYRQHYDFVLVLNADWRRSLLMLLARIPMRIGLDRKKSRFFLTHSALPAPQLQHFIEDHLGLLKFLDELPLKSEECLPRLELNSEDKKIWREWSQKNQWDKEEFLVVHPFSGDFLKTWPLENWMQLIEELYSEQKIKKFLIISGPSESYRLREAGTRLPSTPVHILSEAPLNKVKALIGHSKALVGGDSGPGHIAAALGVPVLSLFGSTYPTRSRPMGYRSCRVIHKDPISTITVKEVKSELLTLLHVPVPHEH